MSENQKSISKPVSIEGVGLHTGHPVKMTLKPALAGEGIVFIRVDLPGAEPIKLGSFDVVHGGEAGRYSALKKGDATIFTVEHLMSALAGLGIDNITIEMNNDEPPGMDGSSIEYVKALKNAGVVDLAAPKSYFEIKEEITVFKDGASVTILPCSEFKVSYALEYAHPMLRQVCTTVVTPEIYEKEVAPCRTFCLLEEAEAIRAKGLGQGANHQNTMVFGPQGVVNNTLHFSDEPARHKVLDCIGDLYLLGIAIKGHVIAYRSGHALNRELLKKIVLQKAKYESRRNLTPVPVAGAVMDVRAIMGIIPHRYPFLLVDRIIAIEPGKKATAIKNVTMNEAHFQGHFPARPVMPGVLMIEAMAQVAGVIALSNPELRGKLAFFMSVDAVKFRKVVEPGDQLVMDVEIVRARSRLAHAKGVCKVDGQVVCEAEMGFAFGE